MTRKIYKTAQGKTVDLGALMLQNEHVRAVGNMNVNARGDVLDSSNRVIDQKNHQIQKQYKRQSNVAPLPVHTSTQAVKKERAEQATPKTTKIKTQTESGTVSEIELPVGEESISAPGGLAAAIARSRAIKQELEKSAKQLQAENNTSKKI